MHPATDYVQLRFNLLLRWKKGKSVKLIHTHKIKHTTGNKRLYDLQKNSLGCFPHRDLISYVGHVKLHIAQEAVKEGKSDANF